MILLDCRGLRAVRRFGFAVWFGLLTVIAAKVGAQAPVLLSSNPDNGATNVPLNASVVFVFDQPMAPNPVLPDFPPLVVGTIRWSANVTATSFSCTWTGDTTLSCDYAGNLPANALITWQLNPADTVFPLESEDGTELPIGQYSGSFQTGAGGDGECDPDPIPDEWGAYSISKISNYVQTSDADPQLDPENPAFFGAFADSPADNLITNATLTLPGGAQRPLEPVLALGFHTLTGSATNEAGIDAEFPAGPYVLTLARTTGGNAAPAMTMPADRPPVPKIQNFAAAQNVDPAANFTLQWNAFTGATGTDGISLSILDGDMVVFQAPDPCVPRELLPTATSIVIPTNTLASGKSYQADLAFAHSFYASTNDVPEMAGNGTLLRITSFTIGTTGGGTLPDPARITSSVLLANGNARLELTGTPSRIYTVERSSDLQTWSEAGPATMSAAGAATFEDTGAGGLFPRFYRVVGR